MEKPINNYRSPIIRDVPKECERLIDTGTLHFESSVAGQNERYHHGETSHTIHVWWARRPHSAMRSLVFSTLCKETSEDSLNIMSSLAMNCTEANISAAKDMLLSRYDHNPRVLDMFGGGGTIPFEAKRLGLDAYSIDSNQLSVFIQKCNMLYADNIDLKNAVKIVEDVGTQILTNLKERTEWLYPLREVEGENLFGYVWTYSIQCPHCNQEFILSKRPWLSKKKGRRVALVSHGIQSGIPETLHVENLGENDIPFSPAWQKGSGILRCPSCDKVIEDIDVLQCKDVMTTFIKNRKKAGKDFVDANQLAAIPNDAAIKEEEEKILKKLNISLPQSELPVWSGIVNPSLYGIRTHSDFLNKRQRLLLLYLIDELCSKYDILVKEDENLAKFVIGALSSLIDQIVDWNCRLSMWIPQNEQVGRGFCGPGIAMLFDYAETDQVLNGPANLWDKLKRIVKGVSSFENCTGNITVKHAHAQELPFEDNFFDAIVTDPPYYDNIYYSILADFFYAWKKPLLQKMEPELFKGSITDYQYELVASSKRVSENQSAHEEYCKQLCMAFKEAARVLNDDGVFSFVYSHSSVNGWEAVIRAYRQSKFFVSSVQPLSIERKGRPRAVLSQAVNTCMTIVARKDDSEKKPIDLEDLLSSTQKFCSEFGRLLVDESGWDEADAGMAVIACTVGLLSNSSCVKDSVTDTRALIEASKIVKKSFPQFSIKTRDSL